MTGEVVLRGRVVTPGGVLPDGVVAIRGGRITAVAPALRWSGSGPLPAPTARTLLPGLVDTHCHGAAGHGFPDTDDAGAREAAAHHLAHGTTTLLASTVSAPAEALLSQVAVLAEVVRDGALAGIHLEGPFLSAAHSGAQDPAAIVPGDPDALVALLRAARGTVRSMTLDPATTRSRELAAVLREHGVMPSLGHTGAPTAVVRAWVRAWVRDGGGPLGVTHLFNATPPWLSRAPGPVPAFLAAAARGEAVVELVADGVHLADETVAAVFDLVGPAQVALVTDAMAAAGTADGRYRLGALEVEVAEGVARLATGPADAGGLRPLAGGTARLLDVVRRVVRHAGVDLADAVAAASSTPARLLGLADQRGGLAVGRDADVLVVDDDLQPVAVAVAGRWVAGRPTTAAAGTSAPSGTSGAPEVAWRS